MVDGNAAAASLRAREAHGLKEKGKCLQYVWQAYKDNGASASGWFISALAGWNGSPKQHPGDRNPPAGFPVWWGSKKDPHFVGDSKDLGDVVISLGGGQVVCTDFPNNFEVGVTTLDEREAQIDRIYLGWTETILGAPITAPGVLAPPQPKEKNMAYSLVPLANSDKILVVSLITGIQAHIKNPKHLDWLNRVKKNEFDVEMAHSQLKVVRGYLTAINPPPDVEIDAQALADALGAVTVSDDADPAVADGLVNDAILANSKPVELPGGGLNNRL